jgi:hypothetical protein
MCTGTAQMREGWAPRLALASLPLGTGAGLYLWRNWEDLMGGPSGGSELTSGSRTMTEMTRIQFDRRYKLVSSLGKGGFGEVWLATDRATGQKVAVKVLSMKQLPRALVEQEVTAMRRCGRHPNVVALLDAVLIAPDDDNPCAPLRALAPAHRAHAHRAHPHRSTAAAEAGRSSAEPSSPRSRACRQSARPRS